jgi:hypothetical protein
MKRCSQHFVRIVLCHNAAKINVTVPERAASVCSCCGPKLQTAQRSLPLVSAKALIALSAWRGRLGGRTESVARARKYVKHDTTQ